MLSYVFVASDSNDFDFNRSLVEFAEFLPEFDVVVLGSDAELEQLLRFIGITMPIMQPLNGDDFDSLYDISNQNISEFSENGFDEFYSGWLKMTNRENSMDEYGQLIFLKGLARMWEKKTSRFVLREKIGSVA